MISVLGYELSRAVELLEAQGYTVSCVETRSRKGVDGSEKRVVRQRIREGPAELVFAVFKTECENGG